MKRLERGISPDQAEQGPERFLRRRFRSVRRVRITHVTHNARNPQRDVCKSRGTKMLKVWTTAETVK